MIVVKNKKLGITIILLITLVFSTYFGFLPKRTETSDHNNENKDEIPVISQIGEDPWWNASYQWRQNINITNPGGYNLSNNWIKISFNYQTLVSEGKMQADLEDIRIVENNALREYHVRKDFPSTNIATVWFQTTITEYSSEYDTYLYYGNSDVGIATGYYEEHCPDGTSWWDYEEGSGTIAYDSMSGYDADLTGTGSTTPTYVSGRIGDYALDFNGNNEYAAIQGLSFTEPNEIAELTVSVWFRTSFSGSSYSDNWAFFDFDRSETFNFYIRGDSGRVSFSSSASGTGIQDFDSNTAGLNDGQWHFACIVYDGTDKIIYLDDGIEDSRVVNAHNGLDLGTGTDRYGFMADGSEASSYDGGRNNRYYEGRMDELRYFNYTLSPNDIKWLANYYPITTELFNVVERAATVSVYVKDVDGRRVPNAEVSLWNGTEILDVPGIGEFTQTTDDNGFTEFVEVPFGTYNITVNYTLHSGLYEEIVYDSRTIVDGEVEFAGLFTNITLYSDLWTIDFEVVDVEGVPLNYGYVEVNNSIEVLETLILDSEGKATFRWLNRSEYYYNIYYDNTDYTIENPTLMSYDTVSRVDATTVYEVKEENANNPANPTYSVNEDTFVPGSSLGSPGNLTVIDATVDFINMQDKMNDVSIWFMDDTGYRFKEAKTYSETVTDDTYFYSPRYEETYDVYGVRFQVDGDNATTCNGQIEVTLTYDYIEYVQVEMAQIDIQVIDNTEQFPVEGVTVRVERDSGGVVTDLKTDDDGYAYGQVNDATPFWYKTGWTYNFSLYIALSRYSFRMNYSDGWFDDRLYLASNDEDYNYTLNNNSTLIFEIDLDFQNRISTFANGSLTADTSVVWGQNMTFSINFTTSDNGGVNWDADDGSGTVITCAVKSTAIGNPTVYSQDMIFEGSGIYSLELNSSILSAGNSGKSYLIRISGSKEAYFNPTDESFIISIDSLETGMTLYDYTDLSVITSNRLSQYYGDSINATLRFYDNNTDNSLVADTMTFDWDYGSGEINPDPLNPGYYTLEIDTSTVPNTGQYFIEISAQRENYTEFGGSQDTFDIILDILRRPSSINDTTTLFQHAPSIYVLESHNFSYVYKDILTDTLVGDLNLATYNWYKLDENGDPLSGPGNEGSGNLVQGNGNRYILDFDTETRDVGQYTIFISLQKNNYEVRNAFMSLSISDRPIGVELDATGLSSNERQINVVKGTGIDFTITLTDPTDNNALLTGVNVTLIINDVDYEFTETSPGVYTTSFSTTGIDAFFMPNTISNCEIRFEKDYYEVEPKEFVIVVGMDEIFPGFPMFYFLMIVIGVAAVVGSLVANRTIQQAKIPKFVKKVRTMKKEIKGRKKISESLLYPSKEEFIVKRLGDKWEMIGLSLEEKLGLEMKKRRGIPETIENEGGME